MDKLMQNVRSNDDSGIFDDDLVEIYLATPERNFFKICVNPNGAVYDTTYDITLINRDSMGILWNPGVKAVVKKYPDRWEADIMIPTDDFGKLGPTRTYPWGMNVCRTRISSRGVKNQINYSIAPTGGPYKDQKYWAKIWMR